MSILSVNNLSTLSGEDVYVKSSFAGGFNFRNKIINGNFDIWQRGTSQTSSGYGSADRWRCANVGSTKTVSQQVFALGQTDVPNNPRYFMRHVVTSVAGSGNLTLQDQRIEGVTTLAGQTATLSFWAKADASKNIAVEFLQNFGTGGSPSDVVNGIGSQLVALTTSWTKYTITVNIPSVSGKTLGTDGNDYLLFYFWFDAGSNFDARAASLGQQSGTFDIAQVQIEEGSAATPFEMRPIGMELSLCQRYYYKVSGTVGRRFFIGQVESTTRAIITNTFPVQMRGNPAFEQTGTASNYTVFSSAAGVLTCSAVPTLLSTNPWTAETTFTVASGLTAGAATRVRFATTAFLAWDAEL